IRQIFPEKNSPNKKTVYRTVRKFNEQGRFVNKNKGNSGRRNQLSHNSVIN
ncbi:hypothetical protein FHG87_025159, partial [Trinorchestia longiramus]